MMAEGTFRWDENGSGGGWGVEGGGFDLRALSSARVSPLRSVATLTSLRDTALTGRVLTTLGRFEPEVI